MNSTQTTYTFVIALLLLLAAGVAKSHAQTYQQALELLEAEQPGKGLLQLKTLAAQAPQSAEAKVYLGLAYLRSEKPDSAAPFLQQAAALDPKSGLAQAGLAYWHLQSGQPAEAQAAYEKALQLSKSKDAAVLGLLAEARLRQEKPPLDQVHELLDKALNQEPKANLHLLKGDAYLQKGEGGPAVNQYEKALALNQLNAKAYTRLGRVYLLTKNLPLALEYLQKAVAANPAYAPAYKEMGELYYQQKQAKEAAAAYQQYLAHTEYKHQARMRGGYFLYLAKEWQGAVQQFREVLLAEPGNRLIQKYLAYSLLEAGQLPEAEAAFQRYFQGAVAGDVDAYDHERYARLLLSLDKEADALAQYQLLLQRVPDHVEALQAVGALYYKQKQFGSAASVYEKVIASREKAQPQDFFVLGRAHYLANQYPQADSAFSKLLELQPDLLAASLWKARTQSTLDPDSEKGLAKPHYEQVIAKAAANPTKYKNELKEAYSYLGYYYYVKSDKNASKEYWNKVKTLDPQDAKAQNALKALQP